VATGTWETLPLSAVKNWRAATPWSYVLAGSDPEAAAPAVARALVSAGAYIISLAESRHPLEDVYLKLIDEDVEARRR
jgi:ABC-2 type transport system ATP-binding protein